MDDFDSDIRTGSGYRGDNVRGGRGGGLVRGRAENEAEISTGLREGECTCSTYSCQSVGCGLDKSAQ